MIVGLGSVCCADLMLRGKFDNGIDEIWCVGVSR